MVRGVRATLLLALLTVGGVCACAFAAGPASTEFSPEDIEFFEKQIRPLLVKRCYECHGPEAKRLEGGLLMTSRANLLKGGDTAPAIVPGKPDASLLIDAINYGEYEMPPKGKLPADEIALLTRWVEMGAPWPEDAAGSVDPRKKFDLEERRQSHWAWQAIHDPAIPEVADKQWPLDPIDNFILARLEKAGLKPNPPADARTLVRRLHFDLIGLPPTAEEIANFESRVAELQKPDPHPGPLPEAKGEGLDSKSQIPNPKTPIPPAAIEELVEKLLASPHFGERWGRHWLDLVRYAESRGHEFDPDAPNAWEYRDYVIRALNADVPYDQFVMEHIAGDLLEQPRKHPEHAFNESIIATGFWHLNEWVHSPVDIRQDECDRLDNQLDVFGKTFLGMTVACARCHDHKFDAISQRDYYALAGFLQSADYRLARFETMENEAAIAAELAKLRARAGREIAPLTLAAQRPILDKLDAYLIAARDATLASPEVKAADAQAIAKLADERGLNSQALIALVGHLQRVKDQPGDPLHLWARLAHDKDGSDAHVAEAARAIIKGMGARLEARQAALAGAAVIIDYARCEPADWRTNGSAFGLGPARAGEPRLSANPQQPHSGYAWYTAARRDGAFSGLQLAPGSQNDSGSTNSWPRAGQTIRTPTFTIEHGPVRYLVRGSGRALAVVDSHRMLAGPLHGGVLMQWNNDQGQVRWVTHNLSAYKGHRAHVEFSHHDDGEMEILMVAQAPQAPGMPVDETGSALFVKTFSDEHTASLAKIAAAYKTLFSEAAQSAARGFADIDPARDGETLAAAAALADWLVRRPEVFLLAQGEPAKALAEAGQNFIAQQQTLIGQIRKTSRVAIAMWDGSAENEQLLVRGRPTSPAGEVPRRLLAALGGESLPMPPNGSGRLLLARQIVDPANPLTARVMVNRIWHHLTGRGIVPTPDNFGVLGELPTHPELLDHLAVRYMREGWSTKRLIKEIVLSRTYQMSSHPSDEGNRLDAGNVLLHRMRIRRLEGEAIRDAVLAVSGRLDRTQFGPPVPVHLTEFMTGRGRPGQSGPLDGAGRRSIYIAVRRNFLSPMMLAFDTPQPMTTVGRRTVSNVPAQALIMMNDPFIVQQAQRWAGRVLADKSLSPQERIERMYVAAYARPPSDEEAAAALAFLREQAARYGHDGERGLAAQEPWADLCHVLFNVKEFIFLN